MEAPTAQLRIRPGCIIAEGTGPKRGRPAPIIWVTPSRARQLIDAGAAELVNAGPSETKPAGPEEKKSESAPVTPAGPLTGSQPLVEPGRVTPSPSSEAVPASPKRRSRSRGGSRSGSLL